MQPHEHEHDPDLEATETEGYKVGEKKTIEEYQKLDENDESLNKWKASLGLGGGQGGSIGDPGDKRKVVILAISLIVDGQPVVVMDGLDKIETTREKKNYVIKEAIKYQLSVKFRVQHEVISGLKFLQVVKRKGIRVDKTEEMMGSYGPNTADKPFYEKTFPVEEAPHGMLARGNYQVVSKFIDDDKTDHLTHEWSFDIKKEW